MELNMKLKVWWIPQVPMKPFYVDVNTVEEGVKFMDVLADYDLFQFENKIKPDYSNMGGLQIFEDNEWLDWYDEETGEDNPRTFLENKTIIKEEELGDGMCDHCKVFTKGTGKYVNGKWTCPDCR